MVATVNIQKVRFEYMARHFFSRWAPQDHDKAVESNAELFVLVRQIYHDAVEPMAEQMRIVMQTMLLNPFIPKENK
jgi:hypothetical protein